jgi:hypothetical protein
MAKNPFVSAKTVAEFIAYLIIAETLVLLFRIAYRSSTTT